MAAAEIVINPSNLLKLESFLNDSSYREAIENSANFNTRLCIERRLRMPFLDPQTGVAQNHCNLFMNRKQRMPGAREGQIYTYPSQRWRKARRQYLSLKSARWGWLMSTDSSCVPDGLSSLAGILADGSDANATSGPLSVDAAADTDSRDGSQAAANKEDMAKEWFYDELAMDELDALDDPPTPESDSDYCDDSYSARKKSGAGGRAGATRGASSGATSGGSTNTSNSTPVSRGPGRRAKVKETPEVEPIPAKPKGGKGTGRGRKKATTAPVPLPYEVPGDSDKPYGCELCGARYKTRPGLTYHYSHSHKEGAAASTNPPPASAAPNNPQAQAPPSADAGAMQPSAQEGAAVSPTTGQLLPPHHEYQDSYVTFLNNPSGAAGGAAPRRTRPPLPGGGAELAAPPASAPLAPAGPPPAAASADEEDEDEDDGEGDGERTPPSGRPAHQPPKRPGDKASPSPYCDFCLGDQNENKKTGGAEELVSCSDCGRSGHPTCLQFTDNMIVSVRKYRWQCIECKCCSVCGTSDNDEQLLFCDDCDRGYHMYCLTPPIFAPPEGSWSCQLCIRAFHSK